MSLNCCCLFYSRRDSSNCITVRHNPQRHRRLDWRGAGTFFDWQRRCGQANEHNASLPRDRWLESSERQAIIDYFKSHPLHGYRRLAFVIVDDDVVAVSPATVYRVLKSENLLNRWNPKPSKKGQGFQQPLQEQEQEHVDIAYINSVGTFCYLCSLLDGYSRAIVLGNPRSHGGGERRDDHPAGP